MAWLGHGGEKTTNWEGGYRVPMVIRWPGTIKSGIIYNDMFSHYDLLPTFAAAGGDPEIVDKCLRGAQIELIPGQRGPFRNIFPEALQEWFRQYETAMLKRTI